MTATTAESQARNGARYAARLRTPIPPDACALRELFISHTYGLVPAVGETTAVPGVVLTPFAGGTPVRFTGDWVLTHAATGMKLTPSASYLHTREAAEWLRRAGLDWDRPIEALHADGDLEAAYNALYHALWWAREDRAPLLTARTSWVPLPPWWRIRYRGRVSTDVYATWGEAAGLAEHACTRPAGELHLHPDAEIVRDTVSPGWGLRCASISCSDMSWLIDWFADEAWACGARAVLADMAIEDGWRAHPHGVWTCPECSRRYY